MVSVHHTKSIEITAFLLLHHHHYYCRLRFSYSIQKEGDSKIDYCGLSLPCADWLVPARVTLRHPHMINAICSLQACYSDTQILRYHLLYRQYSNDTGTSIFIPFISEFNRQLLIYLNHLTSISTQNRTFSKNSYFLRHFIPNKRHGIRKFEFFRSCCQINPHIEIPTNITFFRLFKRTGVFYGFLFCC